jgi:cell division protein FtsZ
LLGAVQGIAELITRPGLINVDFADVRTVMREMGTAMMGTGSARGDDRAEEAAEKAISSPLLEDIDLAGAKGILVNITAGLDVTMEEFETVGNAVKAFASENATVVVGAVIDPSLEDELRVTVVATGIGNERKPDITLVKNSQKAVERPMRPMMHETHAPRYEERVMQQTVNAEPQPRSEPDYLDIPAFLRKQAD